LGSFLAKAVRGLEKAILTRITAKINNARPLKKVILLFRRIIIILLREAMHFVFIPVHLPESLCPLELCPFGL
jgi:hypothetical protein